MYAPSPARRHKCRRTTSPEGRGKFRRTSLKLVALLMKSRRRKSPARTTKRLLARTFPIIEFDPSPTAIIEPRRVYKRIDIPKHCVLCFFQDVIDDLVRNGARQIHVERWETGNHPIYELDFNGRRLAVMHPRVGAPVSAAMLELVIALGARKFIACGGA